MILSRNYVIHLNRREKICLLPLGESLLWFHSSSSPDVSFSKIPSRFSVLCLYPKIPKNTKSDFSATHSTCLQRRKSLGTCYLSIHSRTVASHNSTGIGRCRSNLQATRSLGYSHLSLPTRTGPLSVPPSL